jgi:hypothetical protein
LAGKQADHRQSIAALSNGKALQSAVAGGKSLVQAGLNAGRLLFGKLGGGFGTPQMQPAYAGGNPSAFGGSNFQPRMYTPKSATSEAPVGGTSTTSGKSVPQSTGRSVPQDHDIAPPTSAKNTESGEQVSGNNVKAPKDVDPGSATNKAPKDTDPAPTTADKAPPKDETLAASRRRAQSQSGTQDKEPISSSSDDPWLDRQGYRSQPGERTTTRTEYKTQESARRNFPGKQSEMNCALQSSQQVIRASNGKNLTEAEMITSGKSSAGYNPQTGTAANKIPNVLQAEGVKAKNMPNKPDKIQEALAEGKGVVSAHHAGKLWGNKAQGGHAVHVTGVVKDANGKVTHYVINDTGTGEVGRKVTAQQYEESLLKAPATVTEKPISYGGSTAKRSRQEAAKAKKAEEKATGGSSTAGKSEPVSARDKTESHVDKDGGEVSLGAKRGHDETESASNAKKGKSTEEPHSPKDSRETSGEHDWKNRSEDGFVRDYKSRYPNKGTLSEAELRIRHQRGERLNPETGRLATPIRPLEPTGNRVLPEAGTPAHKDWSEYQSGDRSKLPCFPAGTIVQTPTGNRLIETLTEGDIVFAYDLKSQSRVECPITATHQNWTQNIVSVGTDSGELSATRNHPYWVESEASWLPASRLKEGMKLRLINGTLAIVNSVNILAAEESTYNFEVDHQHNFLQVLQVFWFIMVGEMRSKNPLS